MTLLEALLLGIVQGLTEFLPVSSSGHLILFQHLLGFQDLKQYVFFDLICHLGTLGAILLVFASDIKALLNSRSKMLQMTLAILPLFPLVLAMKPIKALFDQPELLGYCFLATATILYVGQRFSREKPATLLAQTSYRDAFRIGLSQAFAIIPGISRSGTTISSARLLGWQAQDAVVFSFLLSIPTVLGGMSIESYKLLTHANSLPAIHWSAYLISFFTAFFVGWLALKLLVRIVGTARFQFFTWYCLAVGLFTLYIFR